MELYLTLAIILFGIFLFIKEYFSIDTTSILIMTLFIVSGVLEPEEGFSGFNHPATLTLGCMFVVSAAVFNCGLIEGLSSKIVQIAKINYYLALAAFCLFTTFISALVNDSAIVALMIPVALKVCRESDISPSKLLIPISYSALLGGTCTLVGTSTNIIVSSIAEKSGLPPLGMFEFSLAAMCLTAIGLLYLMVIAPFLLPKRPPSEEESLSRVIENYITQIQLLPGNSSNGKIVSKSRLIRDFRVSVLSITRNGIQDTDITSQTLLQENDILKIAIAPEMLTSLKASVNYAFPGDKFNKGITTPEERNIYEVMIPFGADIAGKSLEEMSFREVYHTTVLAIRHRNETITEKLSEVILREGDMLLIYGTKKDIAEIVQKKIMIVLSEYKDRKINLKKAIPAIIIAIGVITTAALGITSLLISAMVGALLLVITSIMKPQEAYNSIEWKVIFMIAGVLSMGNALEKTGGSKLISAYIYEHFGNFPPHITMSLIFLITVLSTNVLSSKATVALMSPIVISLAAAMQLSHKPFLIAVMFACSLTFMTPMSYTTNMMVYGPGNYRFSDYLKVGTPLNILIWLAATYIIPLFFPFAK